MCGHLYFTAQNEFNGKSGIGQLKKALNQWYTVLISELNQVTYYPLSQNPDLFLSCPPHRLQYVLLEIACLESGSCSRLLAT